ncbi:MAG: heavy metal translocating P-type ATPase [Acholeplasmataceae bacterium]|nr:heavy metal translocating P-type ATPase [Acholeplasmataceae bacterium]
MSKKQLIIETTFVTISIIFIIIGSILSSIEPESILIPILFGLSFAIGGFAKAKEGILATIKNKSLNVEILMILAALGAFIVGDYFEGAILILIFSISGVLESYATSRSEKALTSLLKLAPQTALLYQDNIETEVLVSKLKINDQVIVKVGQQVPVDGKIVSGSTSLNQAAITGEFVPVSKDLGDNVYAGSINIESQIIVETTKDPKDSVVQKIVDFVKDAQKNKTKSQSFIDKFEKYYVYVVILMAVLFMVVPPLFNWWTPAYAFNRGVIVLVVGSPCALVASITPAMLSSLSNGARHRILIKGGNPLEALIGLKAVVLDKTGTITSGIPRVVRIEIIEELDREETLSILYTLEKQSEHPLAKSITTSLDKKYLKESIKTIEVSGRGMEATINGSLWQIGRFHSEIHKDLHEKLDRCNSLGHSNVLIIKDSIAIGFVALMDTIRDQAKNVMLDLKEMGIKTVLLTGDNNFTANAIAKEAGIDSFESNCFPEDKVARVKELQKSLGKVMMVGDGINDAPALAIADISVAMGSATDVSLETSDIVIMNDKLENITRTIKLAKRMRKITLQNIIFSTSVILFLLISNVFGVIELPTGVIAHEMSTILVILNSLRLLLK